MISLYQTSLFCCGGHPSTSADTCVHPGTNEPSAAALARWPAQLKHNSPMRSTRSHKPWTNPPTNRGQIPHHFQQNIAQILTISLLHGPYKNPAGPTRPRHLPKRNSVKQRTDANHLRSKSPLLLQRAWTLPDSGGEEMGRICRVQTSRYIVYRQLVSRKKNVYRQPGGNTHG